MFIVITKTGAIFKLDDINGYTQQEVLNGEIDVVDCETMKISTGWTFEDLKDFNDE